MKASSVLSIAFAALFLQSAQGQVCDAPAGCSGLESFFALVPALSTNDTLSEATDAACGGPGSTFTVFQSVALACGGDLSTPPGCPCATEECAAAAKVVAPECIAAVAQSLCTNAEWMEAQFDVSARNLFLHISNDCAEVPATCDAPAFVCSTDPPAPAVVAEEAAPAEDSSTTTLTASGAVLAALGLALLV